MGVRGLLWIATASVVTVAARPAAADWGFVQQLTASDPAANDGFGRAVGVSGTTAFVGAAGRRSRPAVYVFVHAGAAWGQLPDVLTNGTTDLAFGASIAMDGDRAVIGAPNYGSARGLAYVYERAGTRWKMVATIAANAATSSFGAHVALSGDALVVSDSGDPTKGVVYVFGRRGDGSWGEDAQIRPTNPAAYVDVASKSLAFDGSTVLASAEDAATFADVVLVFARVGATWSQQAVLAAVPPTLGAESFGASVAVRGDLAMVGSPQVPSGPSPDTGNAFVFQRSGTTWTRIAGVPLETPGAYSGGQVAMTADSAVVSMPAGALFSRLSPIAWQDAYIGASAGQNSLAESLAYDGQTAIVGAPGRGLLQGPSAGVAYLFRQGLPLGAACVSPTDCRSELCVDQVCCDTACGGGDTTDCQACSALTGRPASLAGTCGPVTSDHECSAAFRQCDLDTFCDGVGVTCPARSVKPNGSACIGGACSNGQCVALDGGVDTEAGADAGAPFIVPSNPGPGCGCGVPGANGAPASGLAIAAAAVLRALVARRRKRSR